MKTIATENEYRDICRQMNVIIGKGTELGDMELLSEAEKNKYIRLSEMVRKWESVHYAFPITVNPLIATIRSRMNELNLTQKGIAGMIGIDEARVSEIMRGKRRINIEIAKRLNAKLDISADTILAFA